MTKDAESASVVCSVDGREVLVAIQPLGARDHLPRTCKREGDTFLLKTGWFSQLLALPLGALVVGTGILFWLGTVWSLADDPLSGAAQGLYCFFLGLLCIFVGPANILLPWFRFDRMIGQWTYRQMWSWRSPRLFPLRRPLSDILAVQVLFGGFRNDSEDGTFETFQLNLVLRDERQPRMLLCAPSDCDWVLKIGRELADFLGVPLLDHLAFNKGAEC